MSCLKCLKYTMCVVNFIFFICGATVFGLGIYLMTFSRFSSLLPSLQAMNIANTLFITGIIITCVSFLGFLGALKENRCLLISFFILLFILMLAELVAACLLLMFESRIDSFIHDDLKKGLQNSINHRQSYNYTIEDDWDKVQMTFHCCGITNHTQWGTHVPKSCIKPNETHYWPHGCFTKLKDTFEKNLLNTGIAVIVICIIEVLGMCFTMTLFCHIRQTGLGYK
ncbi:leukocyte surface antigen CD53-like [Sinocyclocheilus rhinocerous]|uniref:Tetraspanin n=1 Tax=Sinocyclocheilus rhinocerous TaxID=307959 RepID=A0A673GZF5_9TELE|nr:PREDICTED: leukocyte surface antigen CD53-like [Sinocyclocheilus rhinocerous]XP_016417807.1 PREDICTED: leukocyte surface antigen CD53-like [Sinocyclocheilus rhinocerous]XP_016420941.1 PREDICTED: leukocyte surface antigen CD53-like [Sinocyclocheilus rhinocerous]XP_016420942.1 PREDICTED: leukocyte surface antigen CD53-like [Sinocyclocheilus rhinocerous]